MGVSLKLVKTVLASFLLFSSTLAYSFEINEAKTILVPFNGIIYRVSQVCNPLGCYFIVRDKEFEKDSFERKVKKFSLNKEI